MSAPERERLKIILRQAMASFHDACVSDDEGRCWHEHDDYEGHLADAVLADRREAVETMAARIKAAAKARAEAAERQLAEGKGDGA